MKNIRNSPVFTTKIANTQITNIRDVDIEDIHRDMRKDSPLIITKHSSPSTKTELSTLTEVFGKIT